MPKKNDKSQASLDFHAPPDAIIEQQICDEVEQSYLDYAMSVIVSRALPDIRDGLKPVSPRLRHVDIASGHPLNSANQLMWSVKSWPNTIRTVTAPSMTP
jgi:hypothetical protein